MTMANRSPLNQIQVSLCDDKPIEAVSIEAGADAGAGFCLHGAARCRGVCGARMILAAPMRIRPGDLG